MRRIGLLAVTLMAASGCKGATSSVAANAVQGEIRQVLQKRLDALRRGDLEAYAAFVAEPFMGVNDLGHRLDKPALIKDVRPSPGKQVQSSETDILVRSYGDAATASYHQSMSGAAHDELGITETYVREKGHWLLVGRQETPVPFADHPPTPVDPARYDDYVGNYQLAPEQVVTISREGHTLFEKWPGDDSKVEEVPLSETTFVQRGEGSVLTFERDSGKVARLVIHFNNHDLVGARIR